ARTTLSHTASIAGEDRVFDGMCRQSGVIRVQQLEHLFIMGKALLGQPVARGPRISLIGNGGENVVGVDTLVSLGLEVPEFHEADKLALKEMLPPHAPVPQNPVDFAAGAVGVEEEVAVVAKLASLENIDGIITGVPRERTLSKGTLAEQKKAIITALDDFCRIPERTGTPIVARTFGPSAVADELLKAAKIPVYETTEQCALAMYALVRYGQIQRGE
ncbi:MAG: hypothetical protein LC118_01165, partial [Dehalococcoidia bacterium]|nr:hypothetical protein [Dehalococcoidia bacterium]